jgi:hypothetical protein
MRYVSLRRSTPTPPGGVAHPVVGVVPAVLAPRRPPPVTLPNGVWTTPRGHKISAITHTTHNIDCNGYKSHSVADVSLILRLSSLVGDGLFYYSYPVQYCSTLDTIL